MTSSPIKVSIECGNVRLEHTLRPHQEPFVLSWHEWSALSHEVHRIATQDQEDLREDTNCWECGEGFTPEEWENRHGTPEAKPVHAECCDVCQELAVMPGFKEV